MTRGALRTRMTWRRLVALVQAALWMSGAADGASPGIGASAPVLEGTTLHSIGMRWVLDAGESEGAKIEVSFRAGDEAWRPAAPLFQVEKGAHKPAKGTSSVDVPDGAQLYAGSLLLLKPGTAYEVKLTLRSAEGVIVRAPMLKATTRNEPAAPAGMKVFHVVPGQGGGSGTASDPFRGFQSAHAAAQPACVFLLHVGIYPPMQIRRSGEPGKPIVWRGAGDGETIIDGGEQREGRLISADNLHDVWLEDLTIRRGGKAIAGLDSANMVIRRCHMVDVEYGIF